MKTAAKILIALSLCASLLTADSQSLRLQQEQNKQLGEACMFACIVVVVAGVIVLCWYLNKCFPLNVKASPPPPSDPTNNVPHGALQVSTGTQLPGFQLTITNFVGWEIPATNVWLDPQGSRYEYVFSAVTPTNLVTCTNLGAWYPLNYSVTGWISSASAVVVVYDGAGTPIVTNWMVDTNDNGTITFSNGVASVPCRKDINQYFKLQ